MYSRTPPRRISWRDFAAGRGPFFRSLSFKNRNTACVSPFLLYLYSMRLPQAECLSYSTISQVGMARLALRPPNTLSVPCHHTGINRDKPTETYFSSQNYPWCGRQRCVPAIKGKTPGSKPRDLSMSWAFSASCILEGYECQSPSNSSELPGYLDASLPPSKNSIYVHPFSFSDPPRQRSVHPPM